MLSTENLEENQYLNEVGNEDTKKSVHVKNEIVILDKLLECRIKYNKVLLNCDKLKNGLNSEECLDLRSSTQGLLDKLIDFQSELYKNNLKLKDNLSDRSATKNIETQISTNFNNFKVYRNQILNKWENRVKLYSLNSHSAKTQEVDILTKINTFTKKQQNQGFDSFLKGEQEFYGTLIKEFIERKGTNLNSLSKQIRANKIKKQVDTKSSKGRKIR